MVNFIFFFVLAGVLFFAICLAAYEEFFAKRCHNCGSTGAMRPLPWDMRVHECKICGATRRSIPNG